MKRYEVVVGNVGHVYSGNDAAEALRIEQEYVTGIRNGSAGRAEFPVTLFCDGEIDEEVNS